MPGHDDHLLARLNALKPSSVTLRPAAPSIDVGTSQPQTLQDRLEERLKILRSGGTPSNTSSVVLGNSAADYDPGTGFADQDPIRNWQNRDGDEQALEELLQELGPDDQWKLDPDYPSHIESLLREARAALPEPNTETRDLANDEQVAEHEAGHVRHHSDNADNGDEDQQDEEEADDYVKQILAELDFEGRHGDGEPTEDGEQKQQHVSKLDLEFPSAPADMPLSTNESGMPSYADSELEARFSKLGLGGLSLPSTPTSKPSSSKKNGTSKTNLPTYTDDDVDSWCCICNEDGEVRCLGCDSDIYCRSCWQDGHGNGPGQERGHKAVQYNRRPPPAAA